MHFASLLSTDETRHSISKDQFLKLKDTDVVNIVRGDIIKADDLIEALNNGTLLGVSFGMTRSKATAF